MTTTSNTERRDKTTSCTDEDHHYAQDSGWKALFGFTTRKHIPLLVASLITAFIAAIALPLFAVVYGLIFHAYTDYGAGKIDSDKLLGNVTKYCIMLFGITSLSWITNSFCLFLFLTFGELQARSARSRIFEALIQKDMTWYDTQKTGIAALLPTIQTHIRDVQLSLSVPFAEAVQSIVQSLGALGVAFYYSWSLTLVIVSTVPLIAITQSFLDTRLSNRVRKHADKLQSVLKYFTSAIQNIETVKCFNGEKQELRSFTRLVTGAENLYRRVANYRSMQIGVMQFSTLSVFFSAFWYGSHLVRAGKADIGQVITAFWAALMAIQGITGFIPQLIILQKGKMAAARLRQLMKPGLANDQRQESRPQPKSTHILGDIEFRQVTFSYPTRKDAKVLDGISLSFPAQNTTFIVGKSGSGKSTLTQLLLRFYQPSSGKIYIDKVPLDKFDPRWIRKNITVVEQNSVLFNDTIRCNIAMGREHGFISPPVLQDAVSFAALDSTMAQLPEGLETHLGKRADSLSGGQKQRIAIARARVRDTPILILDESTSALDYVTKAQVLSAIRKWRQGKTTIIITHDISQIRPDEYVFVLDNARLVQEGRRKTLEAQSGVFQSFLAARFDEGIDGETYEQRFSSSRRNRISTMSFSGVAPRSVQRPLSSRLFGEDLFSPSEDHEEDPLEEAATEEEEQQVSPEPLPIMEIFRSVWPVLDYRTRLLLFAAAFCAIVHSAATPAFSWVFAQLLTSFYHPEDHKNRSRSYALSMLAIAVTDGLACYLMFFLSDVVAQFWAVQLKIEAMRRILQQPREFFDCKENSISKLSETLDRFAEEARNLPGRFACVFLVVICMIFISTIWSLISSWKLALVALVVSPVLFITTKCYNMISSRWEQRANEASSEVSEMFHETFTNIRTIRCLVLESHFRTKFTATTTAAVRIGIKRALYSASFFGLNYSSVLFIAILLFWYGAVLISTNQFSVTRILEAFLVLILSMNHVVHMSNYITQVNMSRDAGSRLLRLARLPTTSHELDGTAQILRAGDISFHNVNFSYPTRPDHRVLNDISFSIKKGSCTAIVGSSGSGKSTIATLLLKLYKTEPQIFRAFQIPDIAISSLNIQSLDTMILRSKIAIVPQSPVLFPGTVAENITYGLGRFSPYSTTESIVTAARLAGVSDFIASLPQGYETLIGEGGTGLSGGQAQRIAIARALIRQPDILILDEATSALDAVSAGVVRATVRALVGKGGREGMPNVSARAMNMGKETTVIVVTHSKAWMELADHVIMMEQGRVVEQGSYRELKDKRAGAFARLLRAEEGVA